MFSKRLKELRKFNKMTQTDLAEKLGVVKSTIAGYEKGFRRPKLESLNQIAEVFNVSTDYLLGLTDDKTPKEPSKDISRILNEPDPHFQGKPVRNEDVQFVMKYFERIYGEDSKNNNSENNDELIKLDNKN
jgi:transcriptional regulator with XRE-family HTH domain